ncbi:probable inactive receptor kinase [Tanacetum coccineum]
MGYNGKSFKHEWNLTQLRTLSLRRNRLSGVVPSDLELCTELRVVNLQDWSCVLSNNLSGVFLPDFGDLRKLTYLNVSMNRLSDDGKLLGGAIAGIVIGVVFGLVLIIGVNFIMSRKLSENTGSDKVYSGRVKNGDELVFFGDCGFLLDDLLRATAEVLGKRSSRLFGINGLGL